MSREDLFVLVKVVVFVLVEVILRHFSRAEWRVVTCDQGEVPHVTAHYTIR